MKYTFLILLAGCFFFSSCDIKNDKLWEEELVQIRGFLQNNGIYDYFEDPESGYFYYFTNTDSVINGRPNVNSEIEVLYNAKVLNGQIFYESDPGNPDLIDLSETIPGWQLALQNFQIGAKGIVILPSRLGYGKDGLLDEYDNFIVPPNSILRFEIELVEIHPHF